MKRSNTGKTARCRPRRRWLRLVLLVLGLLCVPFVRPTVHLLRTAFRDIDERVPVGFGRVDDASRMNETVIHDVVDVPVVIERAELQLQELLRTARAQGLEVSIAGARHSMGGHTIYRLHATVEQFHRAYPQAREFFQLKRQYDPLELFQNAFYIKYGGTSDVGAKTH